MKAHLLVTDSSEVEEDIDTEYFGCEDDTIVEDGSGSFFGDGYLLKCEFSYPFTMRFFEF
jgi:hypothetical protein